MHPTFRTGDLLLLDRDAYEKVEPERGDIVVVRYQRQLLIKRIVGLPGEQIEVTDGKLLVNGCPVPEEHPTMAGSLHIAKGTLALGKFAVLGDNRTGWPRRGVHAVVTKDQIVGKVTFCLALSAVLPEFSSRDAAFGLVLSFNRGRTF